MAAGWTSRSWWRRLNRMLQGWANYFCLGPVSQAYRAVDRHAAHRLRQWLRAEAQGAGVGGRHASPTQYLHDELGPDPPAAAGLADFPWANA